MAGNGFHPSSKARLEFSRVDAGYNDRLALVNVSLKIPHGKLVAVVGPNGAGKSTLFKVLVGLLPVLKGKVTIHQQPLGHHRDCVAYIPQRGEVDWHFPVTVNDVVTMGRYGRMGMFRKPEDKDREIVRHSLQQMGIINLAGRRIDELSGGQQQRVFLARALAQEPHILLLDEPFTGVDISTQQVTLELLDALHRQQVTTLVSTHDLRLASEKFDLVVLLNRRVIAFGPPERVFSKENIRQAFGEHVLYLDGAVMVDECCPPEEREGVK